jgi:hypothetical protein
MLLIYGQSFSSLENGPGWAVTFQSGKWSKILDGQSFSSLENGPGWAVTFQFGKWSKISDGQSFSSSENGPERTVIFVTKWSDRLLMYHRQRFPLWPVWGNGLGQSFSLAVTLRSGQAEWSASPGSHSFEVHSCEQFRRMVRYRRLVQDSHFHRKWSGQSFPRADSFSPGCTVISAGRMAQLG